MSILKNILLNVYNSIRVFLLNLKRNFLREFLVGIGIIFGVSILIIATTFSNGLEKLVKNSVLGQIKYEEIIIKGKNINKSERAKITIAQLNELRKIEGIERAEPMAEIDFPISAIMKIPIINRNTILGLVGNSVPSTLAEQYIKEELKEKFPNGFHKTKFVDEEGNEKYITPVLFSNFIYEAIGTFLETEGLGDVDLRSFLNKGYQFRLRMGKSMFQSVKNTIELPNGEKINSKIFDEFMNDYLNKHNKNLIEFYDESLGEKKIKEKTHHSAVNYSAGNNVNSSIKNENLLTQRTYSLDPEKLNENNVKIDSEKANPYEAYDYKKLINEPTNRGTYIENCMFVGSAPVSITFTLSLPLEVVQAYKKELEGDEFQSGYNTVFLKINEDISSETEYELKKFYKKYHFEEDEKYKTLRGTSKIINDTIKALRLLVFGLGILMLLLSAMSIFYSFMYIITRRAKEIGLYRFFGATRGKVIVLLLLESVFVGFLCSFLGYLLSYWLINMLLPSILDIILTNLPSDILNLLFPPGTELSEGFEFNDIFAFPNDLALLFMWLGVLISLVSALIPSIKGSYTSLFKTINS